MITGEDGGFVHRMMPPVDWDCGPVPPECYDKSLSKLEIMDRLKQVYLAEDRVKKLANSDDKLEILRATLALETLAEIDADTIWTHNLIK